MFFEILGYFKIEMIAWRHYQPFIPVTVLAVKPGEYPELRLKAWTSRILTTFLSICLQDLFNRLPNDRVDQELMLATVSLTKLSDWMLQLERTPRYMTQEQANQLENLSWQPPSLNSGERSTLLDFVQNNILVLILEWGMLNGLACARFLDTYQQLALWSLERGIFRWPFKPKFHVPTLISIFLLVVLVATLD